jgi:hypothetical protein
LLRLFRDQPTFKELQEHCELIDKFFKKVCCSGMDYKFLNPTAKEVQFCQDVD